MSIFLDLAGVSSTAFFNLLTISGEDGGLGMADVSGDATVFQITYVETTGQPATADRLDTLVNTDFGIPIVITAVNGGNDPYTGQDETGNGHTYVDSSGGSDIIRIVYDVSQACGAGIALFDVGGNAISAPNPVILYHELSHAFHRAINQHPFPQTACPGNTTDEPAAEIDEDVLRTQLGLCLRDVCNHGLATPPGADCGGSAGNADGGPPSGGCAAGNDGGGCFIVSATTGSSASAEVNQLRRLRDRVAAVSGVGGQLIDRVYAEYFQFSPAIASHLEQDELARQAALFVVVRPLLAWYNLAGVLAMEHQDQTVVDRAAGDVFTACPGYIGGSSIVAVLEAIRSGGPLAADIPELLVNFVPRVREAARLPFASWAILDPLVRAWTAGTDHVDVADQVSQWLATAPLENLAPPADPELLDKEIGALARFFDFQPAARYTLGVRLAAAWPAAASLLSRYGFV